MRIFGTPGGKQGKRQWGKEGDQNEWDRKSKGSRWRDVR